MQFQVLSGFSGVNWLVISMKFHNYHNITLKVIMHSLITDFEEIFGILTSCRHRDLAVLGVRNILTVDGCAKSWVG